MILIMVLPSEAAYSHQAKVNQADLFTQLRELPGGEPSRFARGEHLFRSGEPSRGLFLIEQGRVRLERLTPGGDAVTVHRGDGETLIAEASVWSTHYHCDAIADQVVDARCIPRQQVVRKLETSPGFAAQFNAHLAREVMDLRQRIELLCVRSATDRVYRHLALLANDDGQVPAGFVIRQLAEEIGFTPETYSRSLKKLSDARLIRRNHDGSLNVGPVVG